MTHKNWKKFVGMGFLLLAIILAGCAKKEENIDGVVTGTDGLVISFVENFPQEKYIISPGETQSFTVVVDVKNKGAYSLETESTPETGDPLLNANLSIGGFDKGIIDIKPTFETLYNKNLPAASPLSPNGGFDSITFSGDIIANKLEVNKYEPTILATACYPYATKAGPNVCIDPNPFDTKQEKVCTLGSTTLTSQGAPIAVTKIDQEASSKKLRFKITIKNEGNGDVISLSSLSKCSSPSDRLEREDFDLVNLTSVKAGTVNLLGNCSPFAKQGTHLIRLFDGEGFVVCTVDTSDASKLGSTSAYLTPLIVELKYGYRTTVSKQVSIRKLE